MIEKTINNFAKAFIEAQKKMTNASKDSNNPFHKSKYADFTSVREACLSALNDAGIGVLQPVVQIDGKNFVKTLLLHESGETMEGLTEIIYSKQNDAQAQGSGITYARRYGLQSLVTLGAEDDDGNKSVEKENRQDEVISRLEAANLEKKIEEAQMDKIEFCQLVGISGIPSLPKIKLDKVLKRLDEIILENKTKKVKNAIEVAAKKEGVVNA